MPSYDDLVRLGEKVRQARNEKEVADLLIQAVQHIVELERSLESLRSRVATGENRHDLRAEENDALRSDVLEGALLLTQLGGKVNALEKRFNLRDAELGKEIDTLRSDLEDVVDQLNRKSRIP